MAVEEPAEPHEDLAARADIAKNVRTLMENREVSLAEVAEAIRLSKSSASQRLHAHTPFTGEQLTALAVLLRVEPAVFFVNPDELLKSRCISGLPSPAETQLSFPEPPTLTVASSA